MSQENVEIARRNFDAFSRGDLEGALDDLSPEFEFRPSGRFMDTQQTYRGREGYVDFWRGFRAAWEEITTGGYATAGIPPRTLSLSRYCSPAPRVRRCFSQPAVRRS